MSQVQHIQKTRKSHRVKRPTQTGFSSPATHYSEPRIDLNDVLVENPSATFFVRVEDNAFAKFNIHANDVLIVDKSLTPRAKQLALVIKDGSFNIHQIDNEIESELLLWGTITYIINSVL